MIFFSTERFRQSFVKLISIENKYGCISNHLYAELSNKTDDVLFEIGFRLNGNHPIARLIKIRIKSCGGKAKSEGFRLIAFVNKNENKFYLLDIYPKLGPLAKSNMKTEERKECLIELKNEKINKSLFEVVFDNKTKKIRIQQISPGAELCNL
jgi:mRNA-degrading endonuclease RelE of RelBE toxin-antitoxin system